MESPSSSLEGLAKTSGFTVNSMDFAKFMDDNDELKDVRKKFVYPKFNTLPNFDSSFHNPEDDCIYLCGNSLGLMAAKTPDYVNRELEKWAKVGVHGHRSGELPWAWCEDFTEEPMARLVGADRDEVATLNGLTVNLSMLLSAFYRPTSTRFKILMESRAFPSDHYLVASHIKYHGLDPEKAIVCVEPRKGESILRQEDILAMIEQEGPSIAVILFSGVQYYTGQLFDMESITKAGHQQGCIVGFDLAHAIGNVPLKLKEWDVDFAAWCTYKYLNSGAGGVSGIFFNKRWHDDVRIAEGKEPLQRFEGWWGHELTTRFQMQNKPALIPGAGGFKMSNASPLLSAPLIASLEVFDSVKCEDVLRKQFLLTGFLEYLLKLRCPSVQIVTPADPKQRGNQLSLRFTLPVNRVREQLERRGVVCDVREPALRVAPAPLYNSFRDVYLFVEALEDILKTPQEPNGHS